MLYAEGTGDQTDHFADAFVLENVEYGYDVVIVKLTIDAVLLREGRICKNNDHTCLFPCINTWWFLCEILST